MSPESAASLGRQQNRLRLAAEALSQRLPSLLVEADRVAATVVPGVHGRRRTGMGETFWQFRQYQAGDAATSIDWRQSARSRHLFVREQEWEAAESVWLWCDLSDSMAFRSGPRLPLKWERAVLLTLALAAVAAGVVSYLVGDLTSKVRKSALRARVPGDTSVKPRSINWLAALAIGGAVLLGWFLS